jgi:eukaryotic-like serine/threonine-protein kinase
MWDRIHDLFGQAIELPIAEREDFLRAAADGNENLVARLTTLLAAHEALESDHASAGLQDSLDASLACELLEEDSSDVDPGEVVGRYRIVRRAASGGMGVVYLAHDPRLDRPVALKLLPRWRTEDAEANRRLEAEARAASALDHPHIATVYEVGESETGRHFIAMSWYEGGTLRDRLRNGPLPVAEALQIARQLTDGLAAAHRRGIVHRDLKPENVAFGRGDRAVIVDFGIASYANLPAGAGGRAAGTAAYMSPEQAGGDEVDHRTDLWALGTVLFEMLAGRRPAPEGPTITDMRPDVPPPLATVVHRCLEPDPARRFQSAEDVLDALQEVDATQPQSAARRVVPAVGVYGLVAGLVVYGAVLGASQLLLPEWFVPAVLVLLVVGLPVIATTALLSGDPAGGGRRTWASPAGLFTWRSASLAGVAGIVLVGLAGTAMVVGGVPRILDASGSAGGALDSRPLVVLSDFEASEDAHDVAAAAREALAVDLGQSGFVSVFGRTRVAAVLRQMGRAPGDPFDLPTALEVAQRAGAGAVLTGSVSRIGAHFVLTGRAVDPETGDELFAVRTSAGSERLLGAVEQLSREMRRRLGEERAKIRESRPLPEVTTASIEALRLYAQAEDYHMQMDYERAGALLDEAIRLDPGFAMAHRLASSAAVSRLSYGSSAHHTRRAFELRDRLTERERRHVEAQYHLNVSFDIEQAERAYRLLLSRFPDDVRAWNNLGATLHSWRDDARGAYAAFSRALELDPLAGFAVTASAFMAAIDHRPAEADSLARLAEAMGVSGFLPRWRAARAFGDGDVVTMAAICDSLLADTNISLGAASDAEICGSMDVSAGRLAVGMSRMRAAQEAYRRSGRHRNVAQAAHGLAMAHHAAGDLEGATERLAEVVGWIPSDDVPEPDRFITRINLQVHAALLGSQDAVDRIGSAYPPFPDPDHWFSRFGESLVEAATRLARGDGEAALRALDEAVLPDVVPIGWRIWDALIRGLAHETAGRPDVAAAHLRRATAPGYLLPSYLTKDRLVLPVALEALLRAEAASGEDEAARNTASRLARLRSLADPAIASRD